MDLERKHLRPKPVEQQIDIKASDEVIRGTYSNIMRVSHTKEEFVMDFMNMLPDISTLNARIIVSPGHLKRMLTAMADNLRKYEARYGTVEEALAPQPELAAEVPEPPLGE